MENDNVEKVISRLTGTEPPPKSNLVFPLRRGSPSGGPTDEDLAFAQGLVLAAFEMSAILKKAEARFENGGAKWREVAEIVAQCKLFDSEFARFAPIVNAYLRYIGKLELTQMGIEDLLDATGEVLLERELRSAGIDAGVE